MPEETKNAENTSILSDEKLSIDPVLLEELVKAGVLYGRKKSKTHPRMQKYIFTTRNGIEIIDVIQTLGLIDKAAEFLKSVVARGGLILVVGTTPPAKEFTKALAGKFGYPFIIARWLGGTLTNFKTIHDRLQYYIKLKADRAAGRLEKYTKKERTEFDKEIEHLTFLFGGLEPLDRLPEAVIIVNATAHDTAVREARRMKIPIVALASSDADPDVINYLIPANDGAKSSIAWVLGKLETAIDEGKKEALHIANIKASGAQSGK